MKKTTGISFLARAVITLLVMLLTAATAGAQDVYTPVTSETTTMTTGSYRVTEDVTVGSRITISGEVTLILGEGTTLTASKGIGVESGNTLTVEGSGTLRATGANYNAGLGGTANDWDAQSEHGHIIINSGTVIAQGGYCAAGIGGGNKSTAGSNTIIEINGGMVSATGGMEGAGIGGGNNSYNGGYGAPGVIIINGGQVTARGGSSGSGIGRGYRSTVTSGSLSLSWTNTTDYIDVDSYNISNISISKPFVIFGDETTEATVDNIGGKKIIPLNDISLFAYATVSGLQDSYLYSGTAVSLDYSVKNFNNEPLIEGTDYSTELRNSANELISKTEGTYKLEESEDYTLTFNGIGSYHGTVTKRFFVIRLPQTDESGAYIIQNAKDWDKLFSCVNSGTESFSGKTVMLTADISISHAVGTSDHPFKGTFDGGTYTLTVDMTDTENQGTAPFRYISDATIQYVKVVGTVSGNMHCAGLVGFAKSGTNIIRSCEVATTVNSIGTHCGGILGHGTSSRTTISNCLFSGSISGATTATGIIYGWGDSGTHTIENCLSAGTYSGGGIELIHSGNTQTITNCYRKTTGGSQGIDASTMSNDELANALGTGWRVTDGQVVPIMNTMNIGLATVSGIGDYYLYTGSPISINYTVTAVDGTLLEKGTNYTETFSPSAVQAKGDYTLTITGVAPYTGSQTFSFTVGDGRPVTSETTTMKTGPYKVTKDVTIDSRITINGDVTLILCGGATLTASKGISVESGNTLTVEGSGTLEATGNNYNAGIGGTSNNNNSHSRHGHIIINSGTVIAQGGFRAAGIGGGYNSTAGNNTIIEINGGVVSATGGKEGAGIGAGYQELFGNYGMAGIININGGQTTARGGENASGIGRGGEVKVYGGELTRPDNNGSLTLGWTNASDYIDVDSYNISGISFADGKSFVIYGDWNTTATIENIGGKKIVPPGYRNSVGSATINDLQDYYIYSGSVFSISYSVVSDDNIPLTEDTHYTTELKNSSGVAINKTNGSYQLKDMGGYTLTFTGINSYGGTLEKHIEIVPPAPNLTMGDWNHQEATLTWQSPEVDVALTEYVYQYKRTSAGQWSTPTTMPPAPSTSVTLNGLSPVTSYDFRVKAIYGDYNSLYQSVSFTTGVELPYDCGFENGIDGWTSIYVDNSDAGISSVEKYEGSRSFRFRFFSDFSRRTQYLISPRFGADALSVSFYYKSEDIHKFQVGYSTTSNDLSAFTWGDVKDAVVSWKLYEQDFPNGTKYVAVKADFSDTDGATSIYVDDFHFMEAGIKKPANLAMGEISKTSATVTWNAPSTTLTVTGYAYQYKQANDANWSNETTTTATSATISNLSPSTTYQVRVKTLYGSSESLYETIDFTTVVALPYTEGFENGIGGWTIVDGYFWDQSTCTGVSPNGKRDGDNGFVFYKDNTKGQYLISPQLDGAAPMAVSFYYANNTADTDPQFFQVGYSTTTSDISAFNWGSSIDNISSTSTDWQKYEHTFPQGTKYIALLYFTANLNRIFLDDFSFAYVPASVTFAKEGYSTYYNSMQDAVLPEGVKAYIVTSKGDGSALTYEAIADGDTSDKTVPAGTAVMLQTAAGNAAQNINIELATPVDNRDFTATNLLHGSDVAATTTGEGKHYKLGYGEAGGANADILGWYWGAENGEAFEIAPYRAWLVLPRTAPAFISLSGDVTTYTITYDLAGGALAAGVTNPTAYTPESAAITLNNPTREGYTFAGWTGTGLTEATTTVTIAQGSTGAREYTATWKKLLTITADSDTKDYDGNALTKNSYTSEGLLEGDAIESVTISGSQTDVGSSANVPSAAVIKNASNEDVTANYAITYVNGMLTVVHSATLFAANSTNLWATFCDTYVRKIPEGCTAYTISSISGTTVMLSDALTATIPAYTPVLVKRESGELSQDIKPKYSADGTVPDNFSGIVTSAGTGFTFYGNPGDAAISATALDGYVYDYGNDAGKQSYILHGGDFIVVDNISTTGIAAHRCWLTIDSSTGNARILTIATDDESTGITTTDYTDFTDDFSAWYSLDGRKLDGKPTKKGLYIQGGRKVVVK